MEGELDERAFMFLRYLLFHFYGCRISGIRIWQEVEDPTARSRWNHQSTTVCFRCRRPRRYFGDMARHLSNCRGTRDQRAVEELSFDASFELQLRQRQHARYRFDMPNDNAHSGPYFAVPGSFRTQNPSQNVELTSNWSQPGVTVAPIAFGAQEYQQRSATVASSSVIHSDTPRTWTAAPAELPVNNGVVGGNYSDVIFPSEDGSQYMVDPPHGQWHVAMSSPSLNIGTEMDWYGSIDGIVRDEEQRYQGANPDSMYGHLDWS
ncbi:hypothetical protein KVT40_006863 [Elsinoe batatas]|uniref:Uncharacterized protein n=1 Tax=Elsinoe batatas TaxID=2601811 RepID=A0A8K0PE05_9PEZI|nr:hypothetical protein KVT40_006863 [Elsinoe batatas]